MGMKACIVGVASLCVALNVYAGAEGQGKDAHWAYEGEHGPAHWGDVKPPMEVIIADVA